MADWQNNSPMQPSAGPHVGFTTWGLRPRQGGFASVQLNAVGWLALLSPGVVLGLLIARLTTSSFVAWGLAGGFAIWFVAVLLDRIVSGHRPSRLSLDSALGDDELELVTEAARHAGIKFEHHVDDASSTFEMKAKYMARLHNIIQTAQDSS